MRVRAEMLIHAVAHVLLNELQNRNVHQMWTLSYHPTSTHIYKHTQGRVRTAAVGLSTGRTHTRWHCRQHLQTMRVAIVEIQQAEQKFVFMEVQSDRLR